jgi:hypothetical protein
MDRSPQPGDRRPSGATRPTLERAPGERYRAPQSTPARPPSVARALALGVLVGLAGAAVLVLLGGPLSLSAGLLVVASAIGWAIARVVAVNAVVGPGPSRLRLAIVGLALGSVVLGQVGLWLNSLAQGGVLGFVDYLVEVRGVLVPAELGVAAAAAWWTAR